MPDVVGGVEVSSTPWRQGVEVLVHGQLVDEVRAVGGAQRSQDVLDHRRELAAGHAGRVGAAIDALEAVHQPKGSFILDHS